VIKETTGAITPITENIPDQLTERRQWVCWRLETRDDKPTKVPYTPGTRHRASSTDLMTWRTFEAARAAYEAQDPIAYDGVGFVFCSADPFVGIDLDDCVHDVDDHSAMIEPWAQKIVDRVRDGYIEISPSGTGIHIIVEGTVRDGKTRKDVHVQGEVVGRVEMYGRGKFFTMTGETL
jgi:putative DNA primase/helicase